MTKAADRELHAPEVPRGGERASQRRAASPALWAGDRLDRLHRAAWVMCGSREDAEDLVQETFERVLRRPRVIRSDDDLGYLLRALRNTYLSEVRSRSRRPRTHPVHDLDLCVAERDGADARVVEGQVLLALAMLPRAFREVLLAVDIVGLSYGEAASALHVREGTVKSRLHRARRALAPLLLP